MGATVTSDGVLAALVVTLAITFLLWAADSCIQGLHAYREWTRKAYE